LAKKIKLTRPELKRYRDALARFERYLPMLKLKQQQLQLTIRDVNKQQAAAREEHDAADAKVSQYRAILADPAGVDLPGLATCESIETSETNVAGVNIPVFKGVTFAAAVYSLFGTPPWVDAALLDLRDLNSRKANLDVLSRQQELLQRELTKIVQRVNLFEKVKIPECREAIRVIRIKLGDEMTAAVGRGKIAKAKLAEKEVPVVHERDATDEEATEDEAQETQAE
jgi:V/A-type H+/Na+-transporting ATPase subunit D